jgi:excisionase family DNA binding protein
MASQDILTTADIARYCRVTPEGVVKWIHAEKLKAYSTPGGHYRVLKHDFRDFLERFGMPVDREFFAAEHHRILVVDDEPVIVEIIARSLQEDDGGYHIESALDGYEAGYKLGQFRPDLVILDLMMPGMDGFELCRRIRANVATRHTRILAITGYPGGNTLKKIYEVGADLCLVKPLQLQQLRREVSRLLQADTP